MVVVNKAVFVCNVDQDLVFGGKAVDVVVAVGKAVVVVYSGRRKFCILGVIVVIIVGKTVVSVHGKAVVVVVVVDKVVVIVVAVGDVMVGVLMATTGQKPRTAWTVYTW